MKPENIMIKHLGSDWKSDIIYLSDFGSAKLQDSKYPYTEYISTRWYRPPCCLLSDGVYNYKMDIFETGCVFFEITENRPLFPGKDEAD